jgi:PASTA domain-containing protein
MSVTAHARTVRLAFACWLAVAGCLAAGCSHHGETVGASGGDGAPRQSGTVTALPPGAGTGQQPGAGTGQQPGAGTGQQPGSTTVLPPGAGTGPGAGSGAGTGQQPGTGAAQPPGATTTPGTPAGAARLPRMPNLVGRNLQDAQDALHAAGIAFFATSHDATGRNRARLLDLTWKVCSQRPAAGQLVSKGTVPDVGVVQLTESCP